MQFNLEGVKKKVHILLVEDSPTDALLTREAFADLDSFPAEVIRVENGVQAMEYLRQQGAYANAPRPDLVILDWNLPRKHGREVLEETKGDDDLKTIPIVVLSTSRAARDVRSSYQLHANCYIAKPVAFDQFSDVVKSVREFWFRTAALPSDSGEE